MPKKNNGDPRLFVPVVFGNRGASLSRQITERMGTTSPVDLSTTPQGKHPKTDASGVCGKTPHGSLLVYSPSKHLTATVDGNDEAIHLCLLVRQQDREIKTPTSVLSALNANTMEPCDPIAVTATSASRKSQPPRKKAKKESDVVGKSAKEIVIDYFEQQGVSFAREEVEKENWNLCHLLSYAIANNAKDHHGKTFNTQIVENIFAGSRTLNNNMTRIEKVLLSFIDNNVIEEIKYMAIHSKFAGSHILADLTLKASLKTRDGRIICFEKNFDVAENREWSSDVSMAYYAFLKAIIDDNKQQSAGSRRQREDDEFDAPPKKLEF